MVAQSIKWVPGRLNNLVQLGRDIQVSKEIYSLVNQKRTTLSKFNTEKICEKYETLRVCSNFKILPYLF